MWFSIEILIVEDAQYCFVVLEEWMVSSSFYHSIHKDVGRGSLSSINEDQFWWCPISFSLSNVFQACCVILHMISFLTNGLALSMVQSKWKYTHDNRLGKLLIELVTAKTFV